MPFFLTLPPLGPAPFPGPSWHIIASQYSLMSCAAGAVFTWPNASSAGAFADVQPCLLTANDETIYVGLALGFWRDATLHCSVLSDHVTAHSGLSAWR